MPEIHSSQNIIQWVDDNAGSKRKEETRLDKNELTDCAAQFCPFECDILFQDAKNPYFLKAHCCAGFPIFTESSLSELYSFQSTSDSDQMPPNNAYQLSKMLNKRYSIQNNKLWIHSLKIIKYITSGTDVKWN